MHSPRHLSLEVVLTFIRNDNKHTRSNAVETKIVDIVALKTGGFYFDILILKYIKLIGKISYGICIT